METDLIQQPEQRVNNIALVWIDPPFHPHSTDYQQHVDQLYDIVDDVNFFQDIGEGLQYLRMVYQERVFVIVSDSVNEAVVKEIHAMRYVHALFIFYPNRAQAQPWTSAYPKVRSFHYDTMVMYSILTQATRRIREEDASISFLQTSEISSATDRNQLEPSFMYTKLFKQSLFEIDYDADSRQDFIQSWRATYSSGTATVVDEFAREYTPHRSIWWYTKQAFIFENINEALRSLNVDMIVTMGFFLHDLHQQLQQLHADQFREKEQSSFVVYRGQALSINAFEKLKRTIGGLVSFNNFLSTSTDREVSQSYADMASQRENMVGILFIMTIDPQQSSTPFVNVKRYSAYPTEDEILFSMHAVFRIEEVTKLDQLENVYEVKLTITKEDDPELKILSDCIKEEMVNAKGWHGLAALLLRLGHPKRVEEFYKARLEDPSRDKNWDFYHYGQLGAAMSGQSKYREAIQFWEQSLSESEKQFSPTNHRIIALHHNLSEAHCRLGQHPEALVHLAKNEILLKQIVAADHLSLGENYSSIGNIHYNTGDCSRALLYFERALPIIEKHLPMHHPLRAATYHNVGTIYHHLGDSSKQVLYLEKALSIHQRILPPDHATLAFSYNNIAMACQSLGQRAKALSLLEKALAIFEKAIPADRNTLSAIYNNLANLYLEQRDHQRALVLMEKAINLYETDPSMNSTSLAMYYNNMGLLNSEVRDYEKALLYYGRAVSIAESIVPTNAHLLSSCYGNVGATYHEMKEYSLAASYCEKALAVRETTVSPDDFSLIWRYNNMAMTYDSLRDFSKALFYSKKSLSIAERCLPPNHPLLSKTHSNMGRVFHNMRDYQQALIHLQKALSIVEQQYPVDQLRLAIAYSDLGENYCKMKDYHRAISLFQQSVDICLQYGAPTGLSVDGMLQRIERLQQLI